jgi:hypothetical protein
LPLIDRFNKADEMDTAFETLISPLALSFRIVTKGSPDTTSQRDNYFHMFEMIAILNSVVLLSALPKEMLEQYDKDIWTKDKSDYARAAFGHWVGLYERLAKLYKKISKQLDNDKKSILSSFPFGEDFYLDLVNQELISILNATLVKRNSSIHREGMISSDTTPQNSVNEMHPYLIEVFKKLYKAYSTVNLIYPLSMETNDGLYKITVKQLQGVALYINQEIETEISLDTRSLYLYNPVTNARLKFLPEFVKLIECPMCKNWSIYFYNNMDGESASYKCFQTEAHSHSEQIKGVLIKIKNPQT